MRIDPRLPFAAALLLASLPLGGCAERVSTRGSLPAADVVDNIQAGVQTKDQVELALDPARLHLFDADSGEAILKRPPASGAQATSVGEARMDESA